MALSKIYTAQRFYSDSLLDVVGEFGVASDQVKVLNLERFDLINRRAIDVVVGEFYSILAKDYFRPQEIEISQDGDPAMIDIEDLPMMKVGQSLKIELQSSVTGLARPVSFQQMQTFNPNSVMEQNRIIYHYAGNKLYLRSGVNLTGTDRFGDLTIWFPSIPDDVAADDDPIDVPDGPAMEVAIIRMKILLADRLGSPKLEMYKEDLPVLIQELFQNYGITATKEKVAQKTKALS